MATNQQQALWAETIVGMKRALAREDDASESDESIKVVTNRSNKLKRKSKYVQEGHLGLADGPRVYKRRIRYNDYDRYIISRKPQKMDVDGDLFDAEESNTDEALTDAEEDPYKEVKVEYLLRPLTRAADLDKHPTLSLPYKSKSLDELVQHAEEMLQRERNALWRLKTLFTEFQGDATFMPTGEFESEQDIYTFTAPVTRQTSVPASSIPDLEPGQQPPRAWDTGTEGTAMDVDSVGPRDAYEGLPGVDTNGGVNGGGDGAVPADAIDAAVAAAAKSKELSQAETTQDGSTVDGGIQDTIESDTSRLVDPETVHGKGSDGAGVQLASDVSDIPTQDGTDMSTTAATDHAPEGHTTTTMPHAPSSSVRDQPPAQDETSNETTNDTASATDAYTHLTSTTTSDPQQPQGEDPNSNTANTTNNDNNDTTIPDAEEETTHHMTTRRRALNTSPPPHSPISPVQHPHTLTSPSTHSAIHPFFHPPSRSSQKFLGLQSSQTAHDTLMLLNIYLQKQEDVVRTWALLHHELLKAARMRENVYRWCRAEAHVGELSDGEDWVDAEQWGFEFAEGEMLKKGEEVDDEEQVVGTGKKTRQRRAAREG